MSDPDTERSPLPRPERDRVAPVEQSRSTEPDEQAGGAHGHSRWAMIACCVPMLAIAVALVVAGAGSGFLIAALLCTAMMAAMMLGMSGGGGGS